MKTKQFIFGLLACVTLLAVSCNTNSTASEDDLYDVEGIRRDKVRSSPPN